MSSEIELAIKLGKLAYYPEDFQSERLAETVKLLGVDITVKPTADHHLSKHLRNVVEHCGDISFQRFIEEKRKDIAEDTEGYGYWSMETLAYFLRGIGYLYPPSSMIWRGGRNGDMWNPSFNLPGVSNHDEFYAYADKLIEEAKALRESNKLKRITNG